MKPMNNGSFYVNTKDGPFGFIYNGDTRRRIEEGLWLVIESGEQTGYAITFEELELLADSIEEAWAVHSSPKRAAFHIGINLSKEKCVEVIVFTNYGGPVWISGSDQSDPAGEKHLWDYQFEEESQVKSFANAVRFFQARYKTQSEPKEAEE